MGTPVSGAWRAGDDRWARPAVWGDSPPSLSEPECPFGAEDDVDGAGVTTLLTRAKFAKTSGVRRRPSVVPWPSDEDGGGER